MKSTLQERMLPAPVRGGFAMDGFWVWCGSVVKGEDGKYHMFASRWSREYPMHPGWLAASEVVRAVSDTPEGPYMFQEVVLPARGPQYWDGRCTHNPHIMKYGGRYYLYYMGSTHPFPNLKSPSGLKTDDPLTVVARANKRVGVAVSDSIFGPWKRFDAPILTTRPGYFDNFLISNPAPCIDENGNCTMIYKTRSYLPPDGNEYLHGGMSLGVARSAAPLGAFESLCDMPLFAGDEIILEDPFLWKDADGFNLMAKDMVGNICGQELGGIHATSQDGVHWDIQHGKLFYSRNILWDDGVTREMGNLDRPFLLFEDGKPICAFFAVSDGKNGEGFTKCSKTWNMAVPLKRE